MRTLMLVMVCSVLTACKGFGPNEAGTDVVGPAGESSATIVGDLASSVFGEDIRPVAASVVATVAALWLWRKRKALAAAVRTPTTPPTP